MPHILAWRAQNLMRRWGWRLAERFGSAGGKSGCESKRQKIILETQTALQKDLLAQGRKLRVGFIVCDRSKWSTGPLFDTLNQSPDYDCGFITTLSDTAQRMARQPRKQQHAETCKFFELRGEIWRDLYDPKTDRMQSTDLIECDVLFIQQPWGMRDFPRQLATRILCAYVPYGANIVANAWMAFQLPDFHGYLWKYFTQTDENKQEILASEARGTPIDSAVITTGYPKLDSYLSAPPDRAAVTAWPSSNDVHRKRVIFAPHHSVGENSLQLATFLWSGDALKELAKTHPEIDFVLKPHPNLSFELTRHKILSKAQYEAWISDWETGENTAVFDSGDYYDLFRTSDLMITDSVSFLVEYLPTDQPIIRLINPKGTSLSPLFETLSEAFYIAQTQAELFAQFNTLIAQKTDPLEQMRHDKIKQIMPLKTPSSLLIEQVLADIANRRVRV